MEVIIGVQSQSYRDHCRFEIWLLHGDCWNGLQFGISCYYRDHFGSKYNSLFSAFVAIAGEMALILSWFAAIAVSGGILVALGMNLEKIGHTSDGYYELGIFCVGDEISGRRQANINK